MNEPPASAAAGYSDNDQPASGRANQETDTRNPQQGNRQGLSAPPGTPWAHKTRSRRRRRGPSHLRLCLGPLPAVLSLPDRPWSRLTTMPFQAPGQSLKFLLGAGGTPLRSRNANPDTPHRRPQAATRHRSRPQRIVAGWRSGAGEPATPNRPQAGARGPWRPENAHPPRTANLRAQHPNELRCYFKSRGTAGSPIIRVRLRNGLASHRSQRREVPPRARGEVEGCRPHSANQ